MARLFKNKDTVKWTSKGPAGSRRLKGIIKGVVKAGAIAKIPSICTKFRGKEIDTKHDRYLVSIARGDNKKTGKDLGFEFLSPRVATFDGIAKRV